MPRKTINLIPFAPEELAQLARLRYVSDEEPGFTRRRNGSGVVYLTSGGTRVRDRRVLQRIDALAIPPAWNDVWICRFVDGHLQATGRDDRLRKQYLYHQRWRELANLVKFLKLSQCLDFLPALRDTIAGDVRSAGLTERRVLGGMVAILDLTSIRIGNEEYVRENGSYGLASLRKRHVQFERGCVRIRFRGKGGIVRDVTIDEKPLIQLLRELKRLKGQHVFQYVDHARERRRADAVVVNEYLRQSTGHSFTAKDFRVWKASAIAAGSFYRHRDTPTLAARKKIVKQAVAGCAAALGNTPAICRTYYIHAGLLETFQNGTFSQFFQRFSPRLQRRLSPDEVVLARFLKRWEPSQMVG
jgi:DNA topoisomerase-1